MCHKAKSPPPNIDAIPLLPYTIVSVRGAVAGPSYLPFPDIFAAEAGVVRLQALYNLSPN